MVDRYRPDNSRLDLSAEGRFVGAEPVRSGTIERFTATSAPIALIHTMWPPTAWPSNLLISVAIAAPAGRAPGEPRRTLRHEPSAVRAADASPVGCGRAGREKSPLSIRDECAACCHRSARSGLGPNIAQGYWQNAEATAATFRAHIAGRRMPLAASGDLGFSTTRASCSSRPHQGVIIIRAPTITAGYRDTAQAAIRLRRHAAPLHDRR